VSDSNAVPVDPAVRDSVGKLQEIMIEPRDTEELRGTG
jgi:hypothetical protein